MFCEPFQVLPTGLAAEDGRLQCGDIIRRVGKHTGFRMMSWVGVASIICAKKLALKVWAILAVGICSEGEVFVLLDENFVLLRCQHI